MKRKNGNLLFKPKSYSTLYSDYRNKYAETCPDNDYYAPYSYILTNLLIINLLILT